MYRVLSSALGLVKLPSPLLEHCLIQFIKEDPATRGWEGDGVNLFGFQGGRRVEEMTESIRLLGQAAGEWGRD